MTAVVSTRSQIWHYTCDHAAAGIRRDGVINPNAQPALDGLPLSWFTDLDSSHRFEVGLTSRIIHCDRMAHRFEVKDPGVLDYWPTFARRLRVPRAVRDALEDGRLPAHWWVSLKPVEVIP